jgi:hypothetical protein
MFAPIAGIHKSLFCLIGSHTMEQADNTTQSSAQHSSETSKETKRKYTSPPKEKRPRAGPDGLTIRERRFVAAFVATVMETNGKGNGTKAAIAAGWPERSAAQRASNLMKMPHIKSAIAVHVDMHYTSWDITTERILTELRALAFTGMSKFARKGSDGLLYFDFSEATPEEIDALTELTTEEYQEGRGESAKQVIKNRIKTDRVRALELLGKYKKMWTDKTELAGPEGSPLQAPILNINFVEPTKKEGAE